MLKERLPTGWMEATGLSNKQMLAFGGWVVIDLLVMLLFVDSEVTMVLLPGAHNAKARTRSILMNVYIKLSVR